MAITIQVDDGTSYELSEETAAKLRKIADTNRVPLATALEQAILNEKFIEEQAESGAKLLIEKNGSLHELVFRPAPAA
jgi:predicted transcriptional regulator